MPVFSPTHRRLPDIPPSPWAIVVSFVTQLRRVTTISPALWSKKDARCREGIPQLPATVTAAGACVEVARHLTKPLLSNSAVSGPHLSSALHHPRPAETLLVAGQDSCCEMAKPREPNPCLQPPARSPWARESEEEIGVPSPVPTLNTASGVVAIGPSQPHPAVPLGQVVNVA